MEVAFVQRQVYFWCFKRSSFLPFGLQQLLYSGSWFRQHQTMPSTELYCSQTKPTLICDGRFNLKLFNISSQGVQASCFLWPGAISSNYNPIQMIVRFHWVDQRFRKSINIRLKLTKSTLFWSAMSQQSNSKFPPAGRALATGVKLAGGFGGKRI